MDGELVVRPDDDDDADVRPPRDRRSDGAPTSSARSKRSSKSPALALVGHVWYRVRDLDAGRAFYREQLGFRRRTSTAGALGEARARRDGDRARRGRAGGGGVAHVDVDDVKAEADRLRARASTSAPCSSCTARAHLDVYDPDGNRIQLAEDLVAVIRPGQAATTRASCATCSTTRTTGASTRAGPMEGSVQRYVMSWGRPRRRRSGRYERRRQRRRGVVPALQGARAGLRLRRRADARAIDRRRAVLPWQRLWRRAARGPARAAKKDGFDADLAERRAGQPCRSASTSATVSARSAKRRQLDHAGAVERLYAIGAFVNRIEAVVAVVLLHVVITGVAVSSCTWMAKSLACKRHLGWPALGDGRQDIQQQSGLRTPRRDSNRWPVHRRVENSTVRALKPLRHRPSAPTAFAGRRHVR